MTQLECDVVVIGSGVAGLAAALEAGSRGAKVIVLESAPTIGGASAMSGAACCIVGSPEQRAAGVEDNVELALRDWVSFGGETVDLVWARDYLEHSLVDVHDFCAELGITWGTPQRQEGNSVARWHLPEQYGVGIVGALLEQARRHDVTVVTGARATDLVTVNGAVVGVTVDGLAGVDTVRAAATVVATGGFVNNRERLERVSERLRSVPRWLQGGSATARGTGHELLEHVGAQFAHLENVWIYPVGTPDPQDPTGRRGVGLRNVVTELWFNLEGKRFHDESLRGGKSGTDALLAQPGQSIWAVFDGAEAASVLLIDNEYWASPSGPLPDRMRRFWTESDFAVRAETVSELANRTGLPEQPLADALVRFNDALGRGLETDPDTGRSLRGLAEVGPGGFAAVRMFPMAQKNFGGVVTDLSGRVLRSDGGIVPGLYAAGEVAGMAGGSINGAAGLEGTMFGPCLYSGRVAGRNVPVPALSTGV
ncbi:FAD-dependent oxidoreductase [Lysinimonas soli]|uniref:FAD-dependent oxidoreductase n=1 Tax=Lysinimonas soli TaxID=1074233 RepID=A0ABW0NMS5_9MICO